MSRKRAVVVRQGFFQSVAHAADGDEQESDEQEVVALHAFRDRQIARNSRIQMAAFMLIQAMYRAAWVFVTQFAVGGRIENGVVWCGGVGIGDRGLL